MATISSISDLEPHLLWKHFDLLRRVPRPSTREQRVRAAVEDWARGRDFVLRRDSYGNLVIAVPPRPGCETAPVVVLQGHLDMVCERLPEIAFDFDNDPIDIQVEGDWVFARGTTLGADNGIGVAAALAVADDPAAVHGPLEILLTVEEELGLRGALHLDSSIVQGKILLNLDSEDQAFYVGCAGATDHTSVFRLAPRRPSPEGGTAGRVTISGLRGGHSGLAIASHPANAIKLLADLLRTFHTTGYDVRIADLQGGSSRNAIPRQASVVLWVSEAQHNALQDFVGQQETSLRIALGDRENSLRIEWCDLPELPDDGLWQSSDTERIVGALLACPYGVLAMSASIEGLVETSNNLATVRTTGDEVFVTTLARSSSPPALDAVSKQVAEVFHAAGATVEVRNGYPGWQPQLDSPLLKRAAGVYERLFGRKPEIKAIHAGLECGVIGSRVKEVDALSFGPIIEGAHTPNERVEIRSVADFYRFLSGLLADCAGQNAAPPASSA
jgi:dipeptidase D